MKARAKKAVKFIAAAFGIEAHKVWNEDGAALFEYELPNGRQRTVESLRDHALKFFEGTGAKFSTKNGFGVNQSAEIKFDGHRVLLSRYKGTRTIHILLVDDSNSRWYNAI